MSQSSRAYQHPKETHRYPAYTTLAERKHYPRPIVLKDGAAVTPYQHQLAKSKRSSLTGHLPIASSIEPISVQHQKQALAAQSTHRVPAAAPDSTLSPGSP